MRNPNTRPPYETGIIHTRILKPKFIISMGEEVINTTDPGNGWKPVQVSTWAGWGKYVEWRNPASPNN